MSITALDRREAKSPEPGPTYALARWVSELRPSDVPQDLRGILADALLDSVGCGVFGLTTPACRLVRDFAVEEGGPAQASAWGSGGAGRISMINAALCNGTAIHGFDFDDHSRAKIHPGAAVLPAALAAAEHSGCDGETLMLALAAGYEVMNRVSLAANPNASRTKGWHLTGTTGTFGAAAAVSVIFGLDAATTAGALGIAGSQSSGLWAFNADGAMTKRLHPGLAARNGVTAALLARKGFFGGAHVLEASDGGFLAATSDAPRPEEVTRDLGTEWRAAGACFKPYACCGSNHASIDAALSLKREHGINPANIERIVVGISRVVLLQTGFSYQRTTVLNAQMSIRYNVAVALLDDDALVAQFTDDRMRDPALEALIDKIDVVVDADMDAVYPGRYAGIVEIVLRDGQSVRERVDYSRGMPENRMSRQDLDRKFVSLVGAAVGQEACEALHEAVAGLPASGGVRGVCDRLRTLDVYAST